MSGGIKTTEPAQQVTLSPNRCARRHPIFLGPAVENEKLAGHSCPVTVNVTKRLAGSGYQLPTQAMRRTEPGLGVTPRL